MDSKISNLCSEGCPEAICSFDLDAVLCSKTFEEEVFDRYESLVEKVCVRDGNIALHFNPMRGRIVALCARKAIAVVDHS